MSGFGRLCVSAACEQESVRKMGGAYFVANITSDWDCHENELRVQASPQHTAKVTRLAGQTGRHSREVCHFMLRWVVGGLLERHGGGEGSDLSTCKC